MSEQPQKLVNSKHSSFPWVVFLLLILAIISVYAWKNLSPDTSSKVATPMIQVDLEPVVENQSLYKLLKQQELLGVQVTRLEHRQYPQEFIVVQGVSGKIADDLLSGKLTPDMMSASINQLLKLRKSKEPVRVTIQKLEIGPQESIDLQDLAISRSPVQMTVQVSTEDTPRLYEGEISLIPTNKTQKTIVFSFATAEKYHPELFTGFSKALLATAAQEGTKI